MGLGGHGRWLAILLIGLVTGGLVTYFLLPERVSATPLDEGVCDRAFAASDGITAYLAEREAIDPTTGIHPLTGVAEEDRESVWNAYLQATAEHEAETVAGFNDAFASEADFLIGRLSASGDWVGSTEVQVVNQLAVSRLAQELDESALRAGCTR